MEIFSEFYLLKVIVEFVKLVCKVVTGNNSTSVSVFVYQNISVKKSLYITEALVAKLKWDDIFHNMKLKNCHVLRQTKNGAK